MLKIITGTVLKDVQVNTEVMIRKGYSPYIDEETGRWMVYDESEKDYVDSGLDAQGPQGIQGETGPQGIQGETGAAFTYDDFTPEQLEGLRGPQGIQGEQGIQGIQGEAFTYDDFTPEQLAGLTGPQGPQGIPGPQGDAFTYSDFTPEQLAALTGPQGPQGNPGANGTSASVSSETITGGHRLTITSASGTTIVDVMDGAKGDTGSTGPQGPQGDDYELTSSDKDDIATIVYGMLEQAEGSDY